MRCIGGTESRGFLALLGSIDEVTPAKLDVHRVMDTYGTHKTPSVKAGWPAIRVSMRT